MPALAVHIKHSGKVYDVELDTDLPPTAFKSNVYQATGVPVERMKVMAKGGVLKDDASWTKIAPKAGQTFMVIGAAGEIPKAPEKPVVFLEDMDDQDLAQQSLTLPVGLTNLGNTCYMNSSIQLLRAVPELRSALTSPSYTNPGSLPRQMRELFVNLDKTTSAVTPYSFLQTLRAVNPQFAQADRREKALGSSQGFAQQDAEECLGQIISSLREVPGEGDKKIVDQYFMGQMQRIMKCDEAPDEPTSVTTETVFKVNCNITIQTNYLMTGIMASLNEQISKHSPTLNRDATYTQELRMTRLPTYLQVHMVRFSWRSDINKKAKIMRKVKFPPELDGTDLCTTEVQEKILPASRKLKEIVNARADRRKIRKRSKENTAATKDLPDELEERKREREEFDKLVDPAVKSDVGASASGLYELVAIITHKGAAADSGHYMSYVKKNVFYPPAPISASDGDAMDVDNAASSSSTSAADIVAQLDNAEGDDDWFKFDDDKVSVFPAEKLATLDGGGQDSSAYVLLYKSKSA